MHLSENTLSFDYSLVVPTRGNFRMDLEETLDLSDDTATTSLELRGPHGTLSLTGSYSTSAGNFEVEVNGEPFATITVSAGSEPVITGADGEPLTEQEMQALRDIYLMFVGGFDFFEDLLDPITLGA
jgi:hypothetical protein